MFKYNNINYSNYSNNIDYKYNHKIYYSLLLHLLFLFSFSLILSFTSTSSVIAGGGSGGEGGCGKYCDPCDQKIVNMCNRFREYTGVSYIDGHYDHATQLYCIYCTPQTLNLPTMDEIRKRDFTKTPNFLKRDFEMFPKDGSYHIVPDNVVESLKSHISCKDDTSRYILEAYTEKKNTENVVIPYCKKWIVGISDNYVQSTLDNGSVNKLNPNTDIKVFCKEINESKHININNPDTIGNYINLNSFIKLYDGFVCRDGFKPYDNSSLPEKKGVCKAALRYEVGHESNCIYFLKKRAGSCIEKEDKKGNYDYRYGCKQKEGIISCTYTPAEIVSCKARKMKRCKENKQSTINNIYSNCNIKSTKRELLLKEKKCLKLESDLQYCKNSSGRTYVYSCGYLIGYVNKCNKEKEKIQEQFQKELECKQKFLEEAVQNYNECIDDLGCCEGYFESRFYGCYFDASTYSNEIIDNVVKYEINLCQKPLFMDSVRDVGIEKIYDPNLVSQY